MKDPFLLLPLIGLSVMSLFITGSTASSFFLNQLVFFVLGYMLYVGVSFVPFELWRKSVKPLYIGSLLFLALSYLGSDVRGATRWIDIFGFRMQPSEIVKPFIILVIAHFATLYKPVNISSLGRTIVLYIPLIVLVLRQPDLGNAIVYTTMLLGMVFVGGVPWRIITGMLVSGIAFIPMVWHVLHEYQRLRILTFINPYNDPKGAGYNALQAIIAMGSGQLWGLGLGHGTQSRLRFLPEYHTDFVFAAVGEELGFIGVAVILILYIILLTRILFIISSREDTYQQMIGVGIFTQLFTHIFINTGMNVGIVPITGITLPLLSYGGSSILATCISLGLIAAIAGGARRHPLVIR